MLKHIILALAIGALAMGCEDDDPEGTPAGGSGGMTGGMGGDVGGAGGDVGGAGGDVGGAGGDVGGAGGDVGGAGGDVGGAGGMMYSEACIEACTVLADCSAGSDVCPGITDENRDSFYDECLPTCEANPALQALVDGDNCDGTIETLRGLNASFDEGCMVDEPVCEADASYYPGEQWEACISDDGEYHPIQPDNISTIPRVASYEAIGDLLWRMAGDPTVDNFIDAQVEYGLDEGLGSRVIRRYDSRIEKPEGANCRDENAGEMWPEYCVGPGQILPVLNAAFDAGSAGTDPRMNARRVQAALVWFLHVSAFKEANTCSGAAKDCDSSWGYYSGGAYTLEDMALGFGGLVQSIDPAAHEAVMQAEFAVRCWRDLDDAETAEDEALHQQALTQLEAALDRALAVVLIDGLTNYAAGGEAAAEWWAFLEILGPTVDIGARKRDAAVADSLAAYFASDAPSAEETNAAISNIEMLFPCP